MKFSEALIAIEIFKKYQTEETLNGKPIEGDFEFGHERCWISLPRVTDNPVLTQEEHAALVEAGWFFDDEFEAWTHY